MPQKAHHLEKLLTDGDKTGKFDDEWCDLLLKQDAQQDLKQWIGKVIEQRPVARGSRLISPVRLIHHKNGPFVLFTFYLWINVQHLKGFLKFEDHFLKFQKIRHESLGPRGTQLNWRSWARSFAPRARNFLMPNFIRCLIVDGDEEAREQFGERLAAYPEILVVGAVSTAAVAILQWSKFVPDVLFLANTLVDLDELSAVGLMLSTPFLTVIIARHERGAFATYEKGAIDFLLTPFLPSRLSKSVQKIRIAVAGRASLVTLARASTEPILELVKLPGRGGSIVVRASELAMIKAQGNYSRVTRTIGPPFLIRRTLAVWIKNLGPAVFFRVDRFTVVNLTHVLRYDRKRRDEALLYVRGLKEPLLLARRAVLRLDRENKARLAPP